ncbi:hypothetical protein [Arthrobacter psychrolactophilus]
MAPSPHKPGATAPAVPGSIIAAACFLVLGAAAQVMASILGWIHALSPERAVVLQHQLDTGDSTLSLEGLRNAGVITVVLAGLATVLAYLLFAFFMAKGRSWARTATAVLFVLTLSQLVGIVFPGGYTTIVQIIAGAAAVLLSRLPASKKYFETMKAIRAESRLSSAG